MSKINVYSSSASNAIKVFDANSSGVKPDNAILVTTGTEPSNAIQINIGDKKWSSIAVNFGGEEPGPGPEPSLPPYTIRLRYSPGYTPNFLRGTGVLVDEGQNIWDLTYEESNWYYLVSYHNNLLEVIEANIENVTNISYIFYECRKLTTVPLFDTSNVTNMEGMFGECRALTSIPLFDTSNVTNMDRAFENCRSCCSGALAMYQQASTQATPPSSHTQTFYNCGRDTETGSAELAQIPSDWK